MTMDFVRNYLLFIVLQMEMMLSSCQENVAVNKPARQKSDYYNNSASLAVDGNTDSMFSGGSCSHTGDAKPVINNWWKVDLLGYYSITSVQIFNRADRYGNRLQQFEIRVTIMNPVSFPSSDGQLCQFRNEIVPIGGFMLNCSQPIAGRYVSIFKAANEDLTLCEVKVYAVKTSGVVYKTISPNTRCNTTIVMSTTARSTLHCATMCQQESRCGAVNVQRLPANQDFWSCELLSYIPFTDPPLDYKEGCQSARPPVPSSSTNLHASQRTLETASTTAAMTTKQPAMRIECCTSGALIHDRHRLGVRPGICNTSSNPPSHFNIGNNIYHAFNSWTTVLKSAFADQTCAPHETHTGN